MSIALPFSVFNYSSYKEFILDAYEYAHAQDESVSYEKISTFCDFKTRTQTKNVIRGTQAPNMAQLAKLTEFFNLSDKEKNYLQCLFKFQSSSSQASSVGVDLFQELMTMLKAENLAKPSPFKDIEVMTSVLHMTLLSAFEIDPTLTPEKIQTLLKSRYTLESINLALKDLVHLKYIEENQKTGGWILLQKHIRKYDNNSNFFLKKFHNECLDISRESLNQEETSERYLIGASFTINQKTFPRIIQKMNTFVENIMLLDNVAGPSDTVVQFSSQFVKMSTVSEVSREAGLGVTAERELSQQ